MLGVKHFKVMCYCKQITHFSRKFSNQIQLQLCFFKNVFFFLALQSADFYTRMRTIEERSPTLIMDITLIFIAQKDK